MSSSPKSLLTEEIELLVRHFGITRVRKAVARIPDPDGKQLSAGAHSKSPRTQKPLSQNGTGGLESIREVHPEKYRLLSEFHLRLKARDILPEAQDIRYFAQIIGIKGISGKSREDLIPKLIRFLSELPLEKLRTNIASAANISEKQRQLGFSVLTDKLLGKS